MSRIHLILIHNILARFFIDMRALPTLYSLSLKGVVIEHNQTAIATAENKEIPEQGRNSWR